MILLSLLLLQPIVGQPTNLTVPCICFTAADTKVPRAMATAVRLAPTMGLPALKFAECITAKGEQLLPRFSSRTDSPGLLIFITTQEVEEGMSSLAMDGLVAHELSHDPQDYNELFWTSLSPGERHGREIAADARALKVVGPQALLAAKTEYSILFEDMAKAAVAAMKKELKQRGTLLKRPLL